MKLSGGSCILSLVLLSVLDPVATAQAGLTHSWPAEGDATDTVGNADGTLLGGTGFDDGFLGQGFLLDGDDDIVTFGANAGNFGMSDFTVAFAIRATPPLGQAEILSKRAACFFGSFWDVRSSSEGVLSFELRESNASLGTTTQVSVADGEFHTVVFTRAGPEMSAYVDGILRARNDPGVVGNISNDAEMSVSDGPCVGADGTVAFAGSIDEIRLADTAEPYLLLGDFDCGDAALNGGITANDALATLKTAVGTAECPLCACDVNGVAGVTAPDALAILRYAVGQAVALECPACEF